MDATTTNTIHKLAEELEMNLHNLLKEIPPETPSDKIKEVTAMLDGLCIEQIKLYAVCLKLQNVVDNLYKCVANL